MKLVSLVAALACTLALTAAAAQAASSQNGTKIVGTFQDVNFFPPTAACAAETLFEVDFSLVSPQGALLGAGTSCVQGWAGVPCPEVAPPGCHQTTLATFTFNFAEGSITAPMTLDETFVGFGAVQHGHGQIASGTGAYAGATGSIQDNGILSFAAGIHLTFVVRVS